MSECSDWYLVETIFPLKKKIILHNLGDTQNNIRELRGSVEEKERLVCDAQEKERQAISVSKALASKFKTEKEEVLFSCTRLLLLFYYKYEHLDSLV